MDFEQFRDALTDKIEKQTGSREIACPACTKNTWQWLGGTEKIPIKLWSGERPESGQWIVEAIPFFCTNCGYMMAFHPSRYDVDSPDGE